MKKTFGFKLGLLLCAPAMLLLTGVMHADTVFSENFNETTAQLDVTQAGAFTAIDGTNVDIVGSTGNPQATQYAGLCSGPESGNCVDMGGTGGDPSGNILAASLSLAPGTYYLSFDLIGSQRGPTTQTEVILGNYDTTFTLTSDDLTSGIVTNALVTISSPSQQLQFIDLSSPDNIGSLLDNITITTVTPEPGSLLLLATGLLGAAGAVRRKFLA